MCMCVSLWGVCRASNQERKRDRREKVKGFDILMSSVYLPECSVENVLRCAWPFEDKGEIPET